MQIPGDAPSLILAGVVAAALLYRARRKRARSPPVTDATAVLERFDRARAQPCEVIASPAMSEPYQLERSVHSPSRLLRRDIELVFRPDLDEEHARHPLGQAAGVEKDAFLEQHLLAVPTWQPSTRDLSEISEATNVERQQLLFKFDVWARALRAKLAPYWCDCSCPMEGNARYGKPTSAIYNELEGLTALLKYDAVPVGCCGIVLHPEWQRRAYPVTLFTTAPARRVIAAFAEVDVEFTAEGFKAGLAKAEAGTDDGPCACR
jgi:hypothetical protein